MEAEAGQRASPRCVPVIVILIVAVLGETHAYGRGSLQDKRNTLSR